MSGIIRRVSPEGRFLQVRIDSRPFGSPIDLVDRSASISQK